MGVTCYQELHEIIRTISFIMGIYKQKKVYKRKDLPDNISSLFRKSSKKDISFYETPITSQEDIDSEPEPEPEPEPPWWLYDTSPEPEPESAGTTHYVMTNSNISNIDLNINCNTYLYIYVLIFRTTLDLY